MGAPRCKLHKVRLVCPACRAATAGSVSTERKAAAARANGRLGGRPKGSGKKRKKGREQ